MTSSRSWLLAASGVVCAAALTAPPAQAAATGGADADASAVAAPLAHHGRAFEPTKGARARIVEPDGRVVMTDGASDLVSPSSITGRRVQTAIAQLVRAAVPAKRKIPQVAPTLQAP